MGSTLLADRRGVALVIVLALLVGMGAIAVELSGAVRQEANTVATVRARTVARYAAESGVVVAEWRLRSVLDSSGTEPEWAAGYRQVESWLRGLDRVALGDARFEVGVVDLNARLDLNRSDPATLRRLFGRFTSGRRAAEITAALVARPVHRVAELALVPGSDPAFAAGVAPYVTVWGDGLVNLNSAPAPVLAALRGIGEARAGGIVLRRQSGELLGSAELSQEADSAEEAGAQTVGLSAAPTRVLVVSRGWRLGHPLTHAIQAVYSVAGTRLRLEAWQERDL